MIGCIALSEVSLLPLPGSTTMGGVCWWRKWAVAHLWLYSFYWVQLKWVQATPVVSITSIPSQLASTAAASAGNSRLQEGKGWADLHIGSFVSFSLVMVAASQQCHPLHYFSAIVPGLSFNVYQPLICQEEVATLLLWYSICWSCPNCWNASAAPSSVISAPHASTAHF